MSKLATKISEIRLHLATNIKHNEKNKQNHYSVRKKRCKMQINNQATAGKFPNFPFPFFPTSFWFPILPFPFFRFPFFRFPFFRFPSILDPYNTTTTYPNWTTTEVLKFRTCVKCHSVNKCSKQITWIGFTRCC